MFYSTLGSMDTGMSMTHKGGTSNFSLGGVSYNTDTLHTHTHTHISLKRIYHLLEFDD